MSPFVARDFARLSKSCAVGLVNRHSKSMGWGGKLGKCRGPEFPARSGLPLDAVGDGWAEAPIGNKPPGRVKGGQRKDTRQARQELRKSHVPISKSVSHPRLNLTLEIIIHRNAWYGHYTELRLASGTSAILSARSPAS